MKEIESGYSNMANNQKIAFLDRDGIINIDHGYVVESADFQFVDGFKALYKSLIDNNFKPVIITNQSGIARGYFTYEQLDQFHRHINGELEKSNLPAITDIYICPHHPKGTVPEFTKECSCRKPETGMILNFMKDNQLSSLPKGSIMIGDKKSDVGIGLAMELKTFQLDSGKYEVHPDAHFTVSHLEEIVSEISVS